MAQLRLPKSQRLISCCRRFELASRQEWTQLWTPTSASKQATSVEHKVILAPYRWQGFKLREIVFSQLEDTILRANLKVQPWLVMFRMPRLHNSRWLIRRKTSFSPRWKTAEAAWQACLWLKASRKLANVPKAWLWASSEVKAANNNKIVWCTSSWRAQIPLIWEQPRLQTQRQ